MAQPLHITQCFKTARDAMAAAMVALFIRSPSSLEAFINWHRTSRRGPWTESLCRRTRDLLVESWRTRGESLRPVQILGQSVLLDVGEYGLKDAYFSGHSYEESTTRILQRFLHPGSLFIDIGANAGFFTTLAAQLVGPNGKVFAFEPNPACVPLIERHVNANHCSTQVAICRAALTDRASGSIRFFVPGPPLHSGLATLDPSIASTWSQLVIHGVTPTVTQMDVPCTTFDAWAADHLARPADLMKIDVEGAESQVIRGMALTLAKCPPRAIVCETEEGSAADLLIQSSDYSSTLVEDHGGRWKNYLYVHRG